MRYAHMAWLVPSRFDSAIASFILHTFLISYSHNLVKSDISSRIMCYLICVSVTPMVSKVFSVQGRRCGHEPRGFINYESYEALRHIFARARSMNKPRRLGQVDAVCKTFGT